MSALNLSVWLLCFSLMCGGMLFVHKHFEQASKQRVKKFNDEWIKLEKRYAHPSLI